MCWYPHTQVGMIVCSNPNEAPKETTMSSQSLTPLQYFLDALAELEKQIEDPAVVLLARIFTGNVLLVDHLTQEIASLRDRVSELEGRTP